MANPTVDPEHSLLMAGYDTDELVLDLYGTHDENGIEVCDITLAGEKTSIVCRYTAAELRSMERAVERCIEQRMAESKDDAKADDFEFERFMRHL